MKQYPMTLIGIDCACQPENVGLARAEWDGISQARITDVVCCRKAEDIVDRVAGWVQGAGRCLLAMDAPLGWPEALGSSLQAHSAGDLIKAEPHFLFRRKTDRDIYQRFRKMPLEVGADRIGRTARAALFLLDQVRTRTGLEIPLAWGTDDVGRAAVIEVYPAGTLLAYGFEASGYKKTTQRLIREKIIEQLKPVLELPENAEPMRSNADRLDAVVCLLAAVDFMRNTAKPPDDLNTAIKEGWIWVRRRNVCYDGFHHDSLPHDR